MTKLYKYISSVFTSFFEAKIDAIEDLNSSEIKTAAIATGEDIYAKFGENSAENRAAYHFDEQLVKNAVNSDYPTKISSQREREAANYEHPSVAAGGWGNY